MSGIKLVFFDMEGTVFKPAVLESETQVPRSAWVTIAERLGSAAANEEKATQRRWKSGGYSGYVEWMEDTIRIHAKYGLTRRVFVDILDSIDFMDGAKEVFTTLHASGVRTALITGGFKYQADRAARDLGIKHVFAGCEYYWDSQGNLLHWNLLPADYDRKVDFMHLLSSDCHCQKSDLAFVGDGENDIALARQVGTSIAFNGPSELRESCTRAVNQDPRKQDLRAILPYLGFSHDHREPSPGTV